MRKQALNEPEKNTVSAFKNGENPTHSSSCFRCLDPVVFVTDTESGGGLNMHQHPLA